MVSPIGSLPAFPVTSSRSTVGLENQLSKYETQLADWRCCVDGKTSEGKRKIEDLTNKIGDINARLAEAKQIKSANQPPDSSSPAIQPATPIVGNGAAVSNSTIGGILNVFA